MLNSGIHRGLGGERTVIRVLLVMLLPREKGWLSMMVCSVMKARRKDYGYDYRVRLEDCYC